MNRLCLKPALRRLTCFALTGLSVSAPTWAQMQLPKPSGSSDWSLRLGASVLTLPAYPGASKVRVQAFPDFELRYKDFLFADPIRGVGIDLSPTEGLELRASVGFAPDIRRVKDDARLKGLKDIKQGGAFNLGVTYKLGEAFVESTLRSRLGSENQRGSTLEGLLGYNIVAMPATQLGIGLSVKAMDKTYAKTFYSVSAAQSAASGLRAYSAGSGLNSAGVFAQINHQVDANWVVSSHIESLRLRSDAAASPFVVKKAQNLFIVSVLRSF